MSKRDHRVVTAPAVFTVLTVVPYEEEPEYREYEVPSDELPLFLAGMATDPIAERVVSVDRGAPEDSE